MKSSASHDRHVSPCVPLAHLTMGTTATHSSFQVQPAAYAPVLHPSTAAHRRLLPSSALPWSRPSGVRSMTSAITTRPAASSMWPARRVSIPLNISYRHIFSLLQRLPPRAPTPSLKLMHLPRHTRPSLLFEVRKAIMNVGTTL